MVRQNVLRRLVALVALASATTAFSRSVRRDDNTLSWGSCDGVPAPFECASFQVPLDWADEEKGKISLAVIRLPAATQPREGYMFYNPGGPGASGLDLIAGMGAKFQSQLGQSWDIVSWDPRGVGKSEPNIALFSNLTESDEFWGQTIGAGKLSAHGNLTSLEDFYFFTGQAPMFDKLLKSFDDQYMAKVGDNLKFIGSCAVVRDLVALTEAIYGEGADVNFYGLSYGTRLGVYLTQMFPERIGKVIIDGVLDAYTYANEEPITRLDIDVEDSEPALEGWASSCVASPDKCTMASIGNGTVSGILAIIDEILENAYRTYDGSRLPSPTGWTFDQIANQIYYSLFTPQAWKILDQTLVSLHELQTNSSTTPAKRSNIPLAKVPIAYPPMFAIGGYQQPQAPTPFFPKIRYAINCGDVADSIGLSTRTVLRYVVSVSQYTSLHFGSLLNPRWICHRYSTRSVERLPLPMTIKPKNVVLVIGNSADPITPYSSARAIASYAHLGSMARLVRLKAVGHTSISNNSTCLDGVIQSFVHGDVPKGAANDGPDVECDIDGDPFNSF